MSETTYRKLWNTENRPRLSPTTARLSTYMGEHQHSRQDFASKGGGRGHGGRVLVGVVMLA